MPSTRHAAAAHPEPPAKRPRTRAARQTDRNSEPRRPPDHRTNTEDDQDEEQRKEDDLEEDQDSGHAGESQKSQEIFRCPFSVSRQGVQHLCEEFGDNGRKTKAAVRFPYGSFD
jgi:hypothetical protein